MNSEGDLYRQPIDNKRNIFQTWGLEAGSGTLSAGNCNFVQQSL